MVISILWLISVHRYAVTLGEHNTTKDSGREQHMTLEKIINHPDFDFSTAAYDLALLKLKWPARLDSWSHGNLGAVGVACFPAENHNMVTTFKPGPDIYAMFCSAVICLPG